MFKSLVSIEEQDRFEAVCLSYVGADCFAITQLADVPVVQWLPDVEYQPKSGLYGGRISDPSGCTGYFNLWTGRDAELLKYREF